MRRQITFFGITFTMLTFLLLTLAWTISLFAVWPYFMKVSSGWVYIILTVIALLIAGFVNRKILLLLVALFFLSKNIVIWFQNFMLLLSGFLATLVYRIFVYMTFWTFIVQFLIITFSVYIYYTLLIKALRMSEEDE